MSVQFLQPKLRVPSCWSLNSAGLAAKENSNLVKGGIRNLAELRLTEQRCNQGIHCGRCTQMHSAHIRDDPEKFVLVQLLDLYQRLNSTCKADSVLYGPGAGSKDSAAATKLDPSRVKCPGGCCRVCHHTYAVCTA